jgi:hypothetical protein
MFISSSAQIPRLTTNYLAVRVFFLFPEHFFRCGCWPFRALCWHHFLFGRRVQWFKTLRSLRSRSPSCFAGEWCISFDMLKSLRRVKSMSPCPVNFWAYIGIVQYLRDHFLLGWTSSYTSVLILGTCTHLNPFEFASWTYCTNICWMFARPTVLDTQMKTIKTCLICLNIR